MDSILKERILDFQEAGIRNYIKREIEVIHVKDMVTTIVGGRKTGKTYLTYQIIDDFLERKILNSLDQVCYLHFDDEALMQMRVEDLSRIDKVFLSLLNDDQRKGNILFVFDEIHKIRGWENFVLRLKKKTNYYVIITGSSIDLEEDKVAHELRGKTFTNKLLPLSFTEFIRFNDPKIDIKRLSSNDTAKVSQLFQSYLEYGSYPVIPELNPRIHRELLQNYFNSVVATDLVMSKNISNPLACKTYLRNILQKNACPYTHKKAINNLKSIGFDISNKVITDWFHWAEECYLLGTCTINSPSISRINQNYRKIYCIDWSMANVIANFQESRITRNLESVVYWQLIRDGYKVYYDLVNIGNEKTEIDFIVCRQNSSPILAIQVCMNLDNPETLQREVRPFTRISDRYKNIKKIIIVYDMPRINLSDKDIKIISIIDWLINKPYLD